MIARNVFPMGQAVEVMPPGPWRVRVNWGFWRSMGLGKARVRTFFKELGSFGTLGCKAAGAGSRV